MDDLKIIENFRESNLVVCLNTLKSKQYSSLCECCLSKNDLKNILEPYTPERIVYYEILRYTFSIEVIHRDDSGSHFICQCCMTKLLDTYLFKKQVEDAQEKIKKYINNDAASHLLSTKSFEDIDGFKREDLKKESFSDDNKQDTHNAAFIKKKKLNDNIKSKKYVKKVSATKSCSQQTSLMFQC